MKNIINKNGRFIIDLCVIVFAILTLVCNLIPTKYEWFNYALCLIAGSIGLYYFVAALVLNRPKFDWHLVNGNYLLKVVAFVLLVPSIITSGFIIVNDKYSPKNLLFDENLYSSDNSEIDTLGTVKCKPFTESAFLYSHTLELCGDSIIIQKIIIPATNPYIPKR